MGRNAGDASKAREAAREARTKAFSEQIKRDGQIEDHLEGFYLASELADEAAKVLQGHRGEMAAVVEKLLGMKEPVERVATMCGMTAAEVKALRKEAGPESGSLSTSPARSDASKESGRGAAVESAA